jgi:hypothetical protein
VLLLLLLFLLLSVYCISPIFSHSFASFFCRLPALLFHAHLAPPIIVLAAAAASATTTFALVFFLDFKLESGVVSHLKPRARRKVLEGNASHLIYTSI